MDIDKAFKTLKEELLLEGKSWENFYENITGKMKEAIRKKAEQHNLESFDLIKSIKHLDPTATDTNAGKYSQWLINLYSSKDSLLRVLALTAKDPSPDSYVSDHLKRFDEIQSNLEKKDINQYKDLYNIKDAIEEYENKKSTKKLKGKVDYQSGKYGIKKVDSSQESCELGKGTRWCITDPKSFNGYNEINDIFFLTDGNDKYAIVVSKDQNRSFQVYDDQDNKMGGLNFLYNNVPKEILDYIKKEVGK